MSTAAVGAISLSDVVDVAVDGLAGVTNSGINDTPTTTTPITGPTVRRRRYIAINPTYALPEDTVERYGLRYQKLPKA